MLRQRVASSQFSYISAAKARTSRRATATEFAARRHELRPVVRGEGAVRKALWASASDAVRSNTLLVGRWSIRNTQVAAHGAFEPLPNIPANVGLPNRQPPLGLGDGDYSSCPLRDLPVAFTLRLTI